MFRLLLSLSLSLLVVIGISQDCRPFVPVSEGTTWELSNYNAKGKLQGKTAYELVSKKVSGADVTWTIKAISIDDKGTEVYTNTFEAYCKNGQFRFDMAFMMDGSAMAAYESMEVDVDASDFELPDMDAAAGTRLADGNLAVSAGMNGAAIFRMNVEVTERKVESREKKETAAGTFDCIVLSQKVKTKMIVKVEASSKEWYSVDIGMVRSESYNKKGKMTAYSELTALNRK